MTIDINFLQISMFKIIDSYILFKYNTAATYF